MHCCVTVFSVQLYNQHERGNPLCVAIAECGVCTAECINQKARYLGFVSGKKLLQLCLLNVGQTFSYASPLQDNVTRCSDVKKFRFTSSMASRISKDW